MTRIGIRLKDSQLQAVDRIRKKMYQYNGQKKSRAYIVKWMLIKGYQAVKDDVDRLGKTIPAKTTNNPFGKAGFKHKVPPPPKPKKKTIPTLTLVKGDKE